MSLVQKIQNTLQKSKIANAAKQPSTPQVFPPESETISCLRALRNKNTSSQTSLSNRPASIRKISVHQNSDKLEKVIINSETSLIEVVEFLTNPPSREYVLIGEELTDGIHLQWEKDKSFRLGKTFTGEEKRQGMDIAFEALEKLWKNQLGDIQAIYDYWDNLTLDQVLDEFLAHKGRDFTKAMKTSQINREEATKYTKKFQKKQNKAINILKFESNFRKTNPKFVSKIVRKLGIIVQSAEGKCENIVLSAKELPKKYDSVLPFIENSPKSDALDGKNSKIYVLNGRKLGKFHNHLKWKHYKEHVSERDKEKQDERMEIAKEATFTLIKNSSKYKLKDRYFPLTKENIKNHIVEEFQERYERIISPRNENHTFESQVSQISEFQKLEEAIKAITIDSSRLFENTDKPYWMDDQNWVSLTQRPISKKNNY